jgi:hypothetical protein
MLLETASTDPEFMVKEKQSLNTWGNKLPERESAKTIKNQEKTYFRY